MGDKMDNTVKTSSISAGNWITLIITSIILAVSLVALVLHANGMFLSNTKQQLIGTWEFSYNNGMDETFTKIYEFDRDGSAHEEVKINNNSSNKWEYSEYDVVDGHVIFYNGKYYAKYSTMQFDGTNLSIKNATGETSKFERK